MNVEPAPNSIVVVGAARFGNALPLALIAGPCALESRDHAFEMAAALKEIAGKIGIGFVYKTSFDKANRTSVKSNRGIGLDGALPIFAEIRRRFGVPVLTDVHEAEQCARVAEVADVLQIPAFLCRQTDLLVAAARTGRVVNVKKGQFLSPADMRHVIAKISSAGNEHIVLTERGTCFGYNNLVVDMRAFPMLRGLGYPVIYDVTHSLQLPGAGDGVTAGQAEYIQPMASAGVAAGVDGVFMEVHERPEVAKSDAQNALRLDLLEPLLRRLVRLHEIAVDNPQTDARAATVPEDR